jgi:hypothetical protein
MMLLRLMLLSPSAYARTTPSSGEGSSGEGVQGRHGYEWLWLDAQAGVESINLQTFHANADQLTAGFVPSAAMGPAAGLGVGLRLVFLTLGLRGRVASFQDQSPMRTVGEWQVWTLDAELGFRAMLRRAEPYLTFAAGYASFGGLGDAVSGLRRGLDVSGLNLRAGAGLDYYLTRHLSVGAHVDAELLALSRPGIAVADLLEAQRVNTINQAKARILEGDGSSWGWAWTAVAGPGVHF